MAPFHMLQFENEYARLLKVKIPAGKVGSWHEHSLDFAQVGVVQSRVTREARLALSGGMMAPSRFQWWCEIDECVGAAAWLPGGDRKNLAIQALVRSETVSDLAVRHGVSRKFIYQQMHKAHIALADAFSPATPDDEVLFELTVTKAWLRQVIVRLTLIGRKTLQPWFPSFSHSDRVCRIENWPDLVALAQVEADVGNHMIPVIMLIFHAHFLRCTREPFR